uniref:Ovule protein n=1 Tax=Brugia timori TaxID=42155 RepID=A0A0R3QAV4_9BILA
LCCYKIFFCILSIFIYLFFLQAKKITKEIQVRKHSSITSLLF